MNKKYQNVADVYEAARYIREKLLYNNEIEAAAELEETMRVSLATASEAVGEIKLNLIKVRPAVEKSSSKEILRLLDDAVLGATRLFDTGDQNARV